MVIRRQLLMHSNVSESCLKYVWFSNGNANMPRRAALREWNIRSGTYQITEVDAAFHSVPEKRRTGMLGLVRNSS